MLNNFQFFREIDDPRGWLEEYPDTRLWRLYLRKKAYESRGKRSELTQRPLTHTFDLHEGVFPRHWVGKQSWQQLLFAGPNVTVLHSEEHIPDPPDRTTCYWLAVSRYGIYNVDRWINSLEFKVRPSTPWKGTNGAAVLSEIPSNYKIDVTWNTWFNKIHKEVDIIA